ncbi:hypothetical protein JEZ13_09620 [bacterium]|nr:hypothetical protein [bacterium]
MKRFFITVVILAILITNLFAIQVDPRKQLSLNEKSTKPLPQNSRFIPTYNFAIEPVSIIENYYDYFPGSYNGKPMQRVQTPTLDGHWLTFHARTSASSNRRVYKTFIDNTGSILSNTAFSAADNWEGYPGMATTAGGRPLLAYHVNLDADADLEVAFGYDAVIGGLALGIHSSIYTIIDNPIDIYVNGTTVSTNEFIWPSVQIGPSPTAGSQRVYIMGKNARDNGSAISENVVMYYKDFTEQEIEFQSLDGTGWSMTSIPELNQWNSSTGEWRRPYMSFIVHEDKAYYIGYHIAYTESGEAGTPIEEGTLTAFVCNNYGEGEWQRYSTYGDFEVINPPFIDPNTGEPLSPGQNYFNDVTEGDLKLSSGQSGYFSTSIDNEGRIHFPAFFTVGTNEGSYYPELHTVKNITFDTSTFEWSIAEVYPKKKNNSDPFYPNDPIDITQYNSTNKYPSNAMWEAWDQDGDGIVDQVMDDGSWDGIDDGITPEDTDYWGKPILSSIWPYMYWDSAAADGAMMYHLHTAQITNANEHGMMAMVWQDADKARLANLYLEDYPEYVPYQNMAEIVISVSANNGRHWSEPIFLNGVSTPEMQGEIPEFPYLGSEVDYIGEDEEGNLIGRVHVMYLDDETYGSSVQGIGQATGGTMKYMALDIAFGYSQIPEEVGSIYDIQYTPNAGSDGTYPSLFEGEEVTVQGVVTANNASQGSDQFGKFIISELEGGAWNSIYINHGDTGVEIGDLVEVNGTIDESNGFTELTNCSVTILSSNNPVPNPIIINTGHLVSGFTAESYESCLVKVINATVSQEPDVEGKWAVNDGSGSCFVGNLFEINHSPSLGTIYDSITGCVSYLSGNYTINPRTENDLVVIQTVPNVTGRIVSLDSITGIEANIALIGSQNYFSNSIAEGYFNIANVVEGSYVLVVTSPWYDNYSELVEIVEDDVNYFDVIMSEKLLPASNVVANLTDMDYVVHLTWSEPILNREIGSNKQKEVSLITKAEDSLLTSYEQKRVARPEVNYNIYCYKEEDENITANWVELATNLNSLSYIYVSFPVLELGTYYWAVEAVYSNDRVAPPTISNVIIKEAIMQEDLPDVIQYGSIQYGHPSEISDVLIKNIGNGNLLISDISCENPNFIIDYEEVGLSIEPNAEFIIQVRFFPQTFGFYESNLIITNNSSNLPVYSIRLEGYGGDTPADPTEVNISVLEDDVNISWNSVTEDINHNPITPDLYIVYYNGQNTEADNDFYFLCSTSGLSFEHVNVGAFSPFMFYRVKAYVYVNNVVLSQINDLVSRKQQVTMKEVEKLLREKKSFHTN